MKLSGGLIVLIGSTQSIDLKDFLNYKYQKAVAEGHDANLQAGSPSVLGATGIQDLLLNVNRQSPQMGYTDMFQMMAGGNKQSILEDMKSNMMNSAYASMQSSPISPLFLQYAKGKGSGNDQTIDRSSLLYNMMPDPMATILRLRKHPDPNIQKVGKDLLKRSIARNVVTDDPYLPDLLMSNKKDELRKYLFAKQLDTADPYMKTLLYRKFGNPGDHATFSAADEKALIQTKVISDQFGDSVSEVAPNDAYMMFKFLQTVSDKNGGKVPPNIILEVALGNDVAGLKSEDFEEKFGVGAKDFVCAAHEDAIKVPCMVNQDVVTPGECAAMGCCYNVISTDVLGGSGPKPMVPKCYHNLLGKIGSGIAQHLIDDQTVTRLFNGQLPELADLTAAQTWAESQMPDVLRRFTKTDGDYFGNPSGQSTWWSNNYNSQDNNFNIYATPAPSTRDFEWKGHGPTAMPNAGDMEIPEIGGFIGTSNPTGGGLTKVEDLDFIINSHISTIRTELNQNSYTCQLIAPEHMVNCYDNNYEALSQPSAAGACGAKGCCFRDLNLFDNNPVCYRSLRSGFCDVPADQRDNSSPAGDFWKSNPYRIQCAAPGVSRGECLLNPMCCFDTNPRFEGEPHCYKRGGAESLFNQNTGSMGDQCELTDITVRQNCFDDTSKFGKLLNRAATEDQCVQAGCCFSQAAKDASSSLGMLGSMNLGGPHCFKRPNDLDSTSVADNYAKLAKVKISDLKKVCANDAAWPVLLGRQWEKNTITGRYELKDKGERKLSRQACLGASGDLIMDRHKCIYEQGCCFEKSSDPINPWCYKARLVKLGP